MGHFKGSLTKEINTGSRQRRNKMEIEMRQQNRKWTKFTVCKYINTYVQNQNLVEESLLGLQQRKK